jgi:hypothetical protein
MHELFNQEQITRVSEINEADDTVNGGINER